MMTALKGATPERLLSLEQSVAALRADLERVTSTLAQVSAASGSRLARIANTPGGGDNTFDIVFVDGTFTETAGFQTPTFTDRQNSVLTVSHNLGNATPANGDVILTDRHSQRWWHSRYT